MRDDAERAVAALKVKGLAGWAVRTSPWKRPSRSARSGSFRVASR